MMGGKQVRTRGFLSLFFGVFGFIAVTPNHTNWIAPHIGASP